MRNAGLTTPPKQQHPAGRGVQPDEDMQPAQGDDVDVDSPTATANGPAVQPVSVEQKKKPGKNAAKQPESAINLQAGAAAQEDPEKKAKKVRHLDVH